MRRNVLISMAVALALVSICAVLSVGEDSSAEDPASAVYLLRDETPVGHSEEYGWSAVIEYSSSIYSLVISDDTGTSYEWRKGSEWISDQRVFDIGLDTPGEVTFYAFVDTVSVGEIRVTVTQRAINVTIESQTITYGESIASTVDMVSIDNLDADDDLESVVLVPSINVPGNGSIGLSSMVIKNAYDEDVTAKYAVGNVNTGGLTIDQKSLEITVLDQEITYGDNISSSTDKISVIGLVYDHAVDSIILTASSLEPGTHTESISLINMVIKDGDDNNVTSYYSFNYDDVPKADLKVNKKTITVTVLKQDITYGEDITSNVGDVSVTGLLSGHVVTSVLLTADSRVFGIHTISLVSIVIKDSDALDANDVTANYEIDPVSGTLVVSKRNITITADNQNLYYGDPLGTGVSSGTDELLPGHTIVNVIMFAASQDVGTGIVLYLTGAEIHDGEDADVTNNYNMSYVNGSLDISKRAVVCNIKDDTTIQYDSTSTHRFSFETGAYGETMYVVLGFSSETPGTYVYDDTAPKYYQFNGWEKGTGKFSNYELSIGSMGSIIVEKRLLYVNAKPQYNITYGESIATGVEYAYISNEVEGHTLTAVTLAADRWAVGTGKIYPSAATIKSGSNDVTDCYEITYNYATLTIIKRGLTVTANAQAIFYHNPVSQKVTDVTCGGSGVAAEDVLSEIKIASSIEHAGTGIITPSAAVIKRNTDDVTDNYDIQYSENMITINKRPMTWKIDTETFTYDGTVNKIVRVYADTGEYLTRDVKLASADAGVYTYSTYASTGHYTLGQWHDGSGYTSDYDIFLTGGAKNKMIVAPAPVEITVGGEFVYDSKTERTLTCDTGVNDEQLKIDLTFTSNKAGTYTFGASVSGYTLGPWIDVDKGRSVNYDITRIEDTATITKYLITMDYLAVGPIRYDSVTTTVDSYIDGIPGEQLKATCTAHSPACGVYEYLDDDETAAGYYIMSEWQGYKGSDAGNYDFDIRNHASLSIIQRSVTVVAKDQPTAGDEPLYYGDDIYRGPDGKGTNYVTVPDPTLETGIVPGHSLKYVKLTPGSLHAGDSIITPSDIRIEDSKGNDVTSNYDPEYIAGKLHINKRSISLSINVLLPITYNGKTSLDVSSNTGYNSERLSVKVILSSADVGTYRYGDDSKYYVIGKVSDDTGLVSDYNISIGECSDITVIKKEVLMKVPECSFTYNGGTVWTTDVGTGVGDETFSLKITTSSPNAGIYMYNWETSYYRFVWQDGTGRLSNYTLLEDTEKSNGVTIKQLDATVRVQTSKMYDGSVLTYELTENDVHGLGSGDKFISGTVRTTSSECGTYTTAIVSVVTQYGGNNYNFSQELELTIYQRDITITSATASAVEGTITGPLKCEAIISIGGTGYVDGQVFNYVFTGSQSGVGSSPNYFSCADSDTANVDNYKITCVYGNLKIISKTDVKTTVTTDSNVLSVQDQADLVASAEYYKSIGVIQTIEVRTTASDLTMYAEFIRQITCECFSPVVVTTSDGKITLTKDFADSALSKAYQFTVKIAYKERTDSRYAIEYEVLLSADGSDIHDLGTSTAISFMIDPSKVFPVNRTMKIVAVETGEEFEAVYDGQTGELSFNTDHLSFYAVTMEENVGGPSFTGVILVIVLMVAMLIIAAAVIYYLKKNYYI